jgi:hypothetical protein
MKIKLSINKNISIGFISSVFAFLFFYYLLDPIQYVLNDFIINGLLLFLTSIEQLFNGFDLHFPQNPEIDLFLFLILGICPLMIILTFVFYEMKHRLNNGNPGKSNPEGSSDKNISGIFRNILLFKKRWILISLTMLIFLIAIITLHNLLFSTTQNLLF